MRGCTRAFLEVRAGSEGARAAYAKLGFGGEDIIEGYYEDGGAALLMSRELCPRREVAGMATAVRDLLEGRVPRVGVILGSGIGWLAESDEPGFTVPYERIPGMAGSSVEGHQGRLLVNGSGSTVYLMGRRHHYQGYDGGQVTALPSALAALGVDSWLLTTSSGALVPGLRTGDAVVITDHINLSGCVPPAPLCPVGTSVYSRRLGAKTLELGSEAGIPLREGVFACVSGPAYETASEACLLADSGVDVVSMSTVQEALALASQGCEVIGVALVTNDVGSGESVSHSEVLRAQTAVRSAQGTLLRRLVQTLELGK
jgi:purine-nucleoside phosphorylase